MNRKLKIRLKIKTNIVVSKLWWTNMSIAVGIKKARAINKGKGRSFFVEETKKIRKMLNPIKEVIDLLNPPKVI